MAKVDSTAHSREIVFVDPAICDRRAFLAGLRSAADAILLSTDEPATRQIARALKSRGGLAVVHIVAHGHPGEVSFAAGQLSLGSIEDQAVELAAIGEAVAEDGRLLLWACNSGEGARGEEFIAALAAAIGAPVFAAKGKVGAAALGGSWELDVPRSGSAAQPPLTAAGIAAYAAVMATPTTTGGTDTFDGTGPTGGSANTSSAGDTISVPTGTISAADTINGGGGTDTLNLTTSGDGESVDFSVAAISNVENLTSINQGSGNGYNQTFTVSASQWAAFLTIDMNDGNDTLNVVASGNIAGSGLIPTVTDVETGNLTGTSSSDTITLTGEQLDAILIGSGTINLGSGTSDTINLTTISGELNTLGATNGSIVGVEVISASTATGGVTITLSGQSENFTITGSGQADTLTGGTGADTISGGAGADIITANDGTDTVSGGDGNDTINVANNDFDSGESIDGGNNTDAIVLTNATTVNFSNGTVTNVETLTGSGSNDVVTMAGAQWSGFSAIDLAGGAADSLTVAVSGATNISAGNAPTTTNTETVTLSGSAGGDTITISVAQFANFTAINLAGNTDTLNVNLSGTADISAGSAPTITNTESVNLVGSAGADTLTLTSAQFGKFTSVALAGSTDSLIIKTSANYTFAAPLTFTSVENITLSDDAGGHILTGSASLATTFVGNGGADTMVGGTAGDTFNLANGDFASGESITGGLLGIDVIVLTSSGTTVDFSTGTLVTVDTLTGSAGDDAVTMSALQYALFGSIDLGAGTSDSLTINTSALFTFVAPLTSFTGVDTIILNDDGLGHALTGSTTLATTFIGNGGADTMVGGSSGDTFNLANGDFAAGESITGGGATDNIVLTNATTVDFTTGTLATVESLTGSSSGDTVTLSASQFGLFSTIALGLGTDSLIINTSANYTFTVPGTFSGVDSLTLSDDASGHTLNGSAAAVATTFIGNGGADIMTGGSAADTFNLANGDFVAGESITGGGATDNIVLTNATTVDFTTGTLATVESLTGSSSGDTVTLSASQFGLFSTIALGLGTDSLIINTSANYTFTAPGTFSGVESLTLSDDAGGHTLNGSAAAVATTFIGNGGADTMTGGSAADTFNLANGDFVAGESITGGGATDSIVLTNATTVDFTTGTLATVESLTGSSSGDTVTLSASQFGLFSTIALGLGTDSLIINTSANYTFTVPGTFSGVESLTLSDDASGHTLNGSAAAVATTFIGNGGADIMTGGSAADTFNLANGDFVAGESITGGGATDSIVLTNATTVDFTTGTLATVESLTGSSSGDTVTLSASQLGLFSTIALGLGTDSLIINTSANYTFTAPGTFSGVDSLTLSDDAGGHTLNGSAATVATTFIGNGGADTMTGGSAADTFNLANGDFVAGESITGGGATDSIVLTNATTVDFATGTLATVETLTGSGDSDSVTLSASQFGLFSAIDLGGGSDTLTIKTSANFTFVAPATFTSVETLIIDDDGDGHTLVGSSLAETINGNGGADTIIGGSGADTLSGGAGNDSVTYDGADALIAGGADTDTLTVTGPAIIDLSSEDQSGSDSANVTGFENADASGSSSATSLTGDGGANVLTGGSGADTITGGGGNDTIDGGGDTDTAVYSGSWTDYTITLDGATYTIVDNRGGSPDGTDTVTNVENFQFSNGTFAAAQILNDVPTDIGLSAASVAEGAPNGTVVGALSRTDADSALGDTASYSLIDDAGGRFAVSGGNLVVADGGLLDFETSTSHSVTVRITDAHGPTYDEAFIIGVTNANESPVITSNGGDATASVNVAENTTAVTTVTADDPDAGASLTYAIVGGADAARFEIDDTTGVLTFATARNFEAPTDVGGNNVYDVEVEVSDGLGGSDVQTLAVTVTNANEAPVITSNGGDPTASVNVAENTTAVTTVTADDPDAGATQTYSILGGADAAKFEIDDTTGVLTFVTAPNFEAPTDVGGNNVYDVEVEVSDGLGGSDVQSLAVTVTNANEAPVITSNGGGPTASLNVAENGTAVTTVTASDPDAGATRAYSIVGGADAGKFGIGVSSGILAFLVAPNFEAPTDVGGNNVYDVAVQVSDGLGGIDIQTLAVTVTNANEAPVIVSNGGGATASLSIAENGTAVTTVSATDADAGAVLSYSLAGGADQSRFTISASGVLAFVAAPDFDLPGDAGGNNVYDVAVQVSDGLGGIDIQTLAVTVTNANESPVIVSNGGGATASVDVAENSTAVTTVSASDADAGAVLSYTLVGGADQGKFTIDAAGVLAFVAAPDFEAPGDADGDNIYDVAVQVSDGLGGTDLQTFAVTVSDVGGLSWSGTTGKDSGWGTVENDAMYGDAGKDSLDGLSGDDWLNGGGGADQLSGSLGSDTLVVDDRQDRVIELTDEGIDTIEASVSYTLSANVENLTLTGNAASGTGNQLDNLITGSSRANDLDGMAGADTLTGQSGKDTLCGGAGADMLLGGSGSDVFEFARTSDSRGPGIDTLGDFGGGDRIDLRQIDADSKLAGNQKFAFVGKNDFTGRGGGELNFVDGMLSADVNGDKIADFQVAIDASKLAAHDFFL